MNFSNDRVIEDLMAVAMLHKDASKEQLKEAQVVAKHLAKSTGPFIKSTDTLIILLGGVMFVCAIVNLILTKAKEVNI